MAPKSKPAQVTHHADVTIDASADHSETLDAMAGASEDNSPEKAISETSTSLFSSFIDASSNSELPDERKVKTITGYVFGDSSGTAVGIGFQGLYDLKDVLVKSTKQDQKVGNHKMLKITAGMSTSFFSVPEIDGGSKQTLSKVWALTHTSSQLVSPDVTGKFDRWPLLLEAFLGVFTDKQNSGGIFDEVRFESVIHDDYRLSEDEARALFIAVQKSDAYAKELQERAKKARNSPQKRARDESSPSPAALVTPKKIVEFKSF